jgi:hypothetical protein
MKHIMRQDAVVPADIWASGTVAQLKPANDASLLAIAEAYEQMYGKAYARRWLAEEQKRQQAAKGVEESSTPQDLFSFHSQSNATCSMGVSQPEKPQEPLEPHESHRTASELLQPYQTLLGASYDTLHLLARWSIENATEQDPAPHLMTTYWTLEEALGKNERTLRRHLVETGHAWSETVRHLIDIRPCYGTMTWWNKETQQDEEHTRPIGLVIRFFPNGRQSPKACVKRWGRRDLIADADDGMTRPSRPAWVTEQCTRGRYQRTQGLMSAHSSVTEQSSTYSWFMVRLGLTVTNRRENKKDPCKLYADIPAQYVLDTLRQDLQVTLEGARERGASLRRARSLWVDTAAKMLAERFGEHQANKQHESDEHVTHWDGFTDLWRRNLWTAVKAELYGGTSYGWRLLQRMIALAVEVEGDPEVRRPTAYAWALVRDELEALRRDYGTGMAGEVILA